MSTFSSLAFDFPVSHPHLAEGVCAYCDQSIPNDKAREIAQRHQADEQERTNAIEARLRERFEADRLQAEEKASVAVALAKQEAASQLHEIQEQARCAVETARVQHEKVLSDALAAQKDEISQSAALELQKFQNEAAQALQEKQGAESKLKEANDSFTQQLATLESLRQVAIDDAVAAAKQAATSEATTEISKLKESISEMQQSKSLVENEASAKIADAEAKQRIAEGLLAATQEKLKAEADARISEVREALAEDKTLAVQAEQRKHFEEIQNLRAKVEKLTRELDNKKSDELGDEAELDLFNSLKAAFPEDKIDRVEKGEPGADIIHQVIQNGQVCGTIVYESKNRKKWEDAYATKLHTDMIAAEADHAILSTYKFPKDKKELDLESGVILASPARVLVLAALLRQHILQVHKLHVGNIDRSQKTQQLYAFMSSEQCGNFMESLQAGITELEEIDADEAKAHAKVWKKRGQRIKAMEQTLARYLFSIEAIIGTAELASSA
jgi:hypothetical protein